MEYGRAADIIENASSCDLEFKVSSFSDDEGCEVEQRTGDAGEESSAWSFLLAGPLSKNKSTAYTLRHAKQYMKMKVYE